MTATNMEGFHMSQTHDTDARIATDESRPETSLADEQPATPPSDVSTASPAAPERSGDPTNSDGIVLLANADDYQRRWEHIQSAFVDEPRRAVEEADTLVAEVIGALADSFSNERQRLEGQWGSGDNASTDDLRIALQRYRSFFQRLLTR